VPPEKSLQLWTKADGWKGPVSLGLIQPDKAVEVLLVQLPPLRPNQLFEITLEPKSGSPIGRPTGPILYIGRAVRML
jgi:anti-sigma-K factor RskA